MMGMEALLPDLHKRAFARAQDLSEFWYEQKRYERFGTWQPHGQTLPQHHADAKRRALGAIGLARDNTNNDDVNLLQLEMEFDEFVLQQQRENDEWFRDQMRFNEERAQRLAEAATAAAPAAVEETPSPTLQQTATSASSPGGLRILPVTKTVTWDAFTSESTRRFREYCSTQVRFPESREAFEPLVHISDRVKAELDGRLCAYTDLHRLRGTFPQDKETLVSSLDLIIKRYWDTASTDVHKDVLQRREVLMTSLRKYLPHKPLTDFVEKSARFNSDVTTEEMDTLSTQPNVNAFFRALKENRGGSMCLTRLIRRVEDEVRKKPSLPRFNEICNMIIMESSTLLEIYEPLESLGWSYTPVNNRVGVAEDNPERVKRGEAPLIAKKPKTPAVDPRELLHCNICGRSRHEADSCTNPNPDRNTDSAVTFRQSTNGKRWLSLGISEVPYNVKLDGTLVDTTKSNKRDQDVIAIMNATKQSSKRPAPGGGGASRPPNRGHGHGGSKPPAKKTRPCKTDFEILASLAAVTTSPRNVINATVHCNGQSKLFRCLIDTGASQDNYASPLVRKWFAEAGNVVSPESEAMTHGSKCLVCSPISKTCISCSSASVLTLTFLNERDNVNETTSPIKMKFLDTFISNRYDIIIGLDTICDYNIIFKLPKRFSSGTEVQGVVESDQLCSLSPIESNTRGPNLDPREAKRPRKPATPHMTPYDSTALAVVEKLRNA